MFIDGTALGLVFGVYGARVHTESLVAALGRDRHGVHGILRRAEEYRERVGRPQPQCVAAAIVDAIERGRDEVVIPRWLGFPIWLRGAWPGLYRALARRLG